MALIHPTAIVDPAAEIDSSVQIGPFTIIEGPVKVGPGTRIQSHVHLSGHTTIGADNEIHMGAVIGHFPQHKAYKPSDSGVVIGDRNIIREYVSIHRAYHPGKSTVLGNDNFLMGFSHVAHDVTIGSNIVMANGALVAGHSQVDDFANISGNVAIHQFVRIGTLAMVGGLGRVTKDIPPFMLVEGDTTVRGLNTVGLRRGGYSPEHRNQIKRAYRILYRSGLNVPQALEQLEAEYAEGPVKTLINFIRGSVRGICRHAPISHGPGSNNPEE